MFEWHHIKPCQLNRYWHRLFIQRQNASTAYKYKIVNAIDITGQGKSVCFDHTWRNLGEEKALPLAFLSY
jgi:hypothetical protein